MWIREAQKPPDPEGDPEHWYIYIILQRLNVIKKSQTAEIKAFLTNLA
jgi:hypothetical protein